MNQDRTFSKILIIGILILVLAGGFFAWQKFGRQKQETSLPTQQKTQIGVTAIWNCTSISCLGKWHSCNVDSTNGNASCISNAVEQYNASSDAINFTKSLGWTGYLSHFQEMGKIDLGTVVFPDRANTNEAYYLLNGSPSSVSTEISQDREAELMPKIKNDPLYREVINKYPAISLWEFNPQFIEKQVLSNNGERFVLVYRLVNGCRLCNTEYSAKIGFDFDSIGKFSKVIFLQIVK